MAAKKNLLGFWTRSIFLGSCFLGAFYLSLNPAQAELNIQSDYTAPMPNAIVNEYGALAQDAPQGATSLRVQTFPGPAKHPLTDTLQPSDVILIIQMQGAEMKTSDDVTYGRPTNLNGAGLYEFAQVASLETPGANQLIIHLANQGLNNSYLAKGHTQVIRVPVRNKVTIPPGTSITALPWDGNVGGIVAMIGDTVNLTGGTIDVSGEGFRGGGLPINVSPAPDPAIDFNNYVTMDTQFGSQKGEGICGSLADYQNLRGTLGRGAPCNGGGGGNSVQAGGGGGANGGELTQWTGQGVMNTSNPTFISPWKLDPNFISTMQFSTSSGGGRGGYTLSENSLNPTVSGPASTVGMGCPWGGNCRLERGGLGGRPVPTNPNTALFFGGGGGAGESRVKQDAMGGGIGGNGGGIVLIFAHHLSGQNTPTGDIIASGTPGGDASGNSHRTGGGGGGGAGGSILIKATETNHILANADGGKGGDHDPTTGVMTIANGPGGGGGGGIRILASKGTPGNPPHGGVSGVTKATPMMNSFPINGATDGGSGREITLFLPIDELTFTAKVTSGNTLVPGKTASFQITLANPNPSLFNIVQLKTSANPNYNSVTWTCKAGTFSHCAQPSGSNHLSSFPLYVGPGDQTSFNLNIPIPATAACGDLTLTAALENALDSDKVITVPTKIHGPVSVWLSATPNPLQGISPVSYQVQVQNTYPNCPTQTGLRLVITLPPNSHLKDASGDTWNCQSADNIVTCTQKDGTDVASAVNIRLIPPAGTDNAEIKADLFLSDSGIEPAAQASLTTLVHGGVGGVSGGGFCSLGEDGGSASGTLVFVALALLGILGRRYLPIPR